ncbi:sensor histidine kinase [Tellurirhabdus rosea]|uniref:sensor histidine kinase n=1 Tax=Tellurirhabdus rosea TaxID=2674997 RepID=UPI00225336D9|nr:sensor histidine kinase [Tellurirhabdus rosea]
MQLYIAVGTAVLLVMAIFIIVFVAYYQQKQIRQQLAMKEMQETNRKELMAATLQAQEQERRRIAQDLHDEIGTMLSVTKLSLNQLGRSIDADDQGSAMFVQKTRSLLDETIANVRRISRDLVPTTLERFGLGSALEELAEKASQGDVHVELTCPEKIASLPQSTSLMLYRITQELTNNAIRHGNATHIQIQLHCEREALFLSVVDNGSGFDLDETLQDKKRGLGLRNIESRLSVVDGNVTFDTAPGRGTRVHVQVRMPQMVEAPRALVEA